MRVWTRRTWVMLSALGGFTSVAVGAFAAHGVSDPRTADLLRTGALYGFVHVIATLLCASLIEMGAQRARFAPGFFLSGVLLFSGSLYAMAAGAPRWLGAVTPFGGLLFLTGWLVLAWAAAKLD